MVNLSTNLREPCSGTIRCLARFVGSGQLWAALTAKRTSRGHMLRDICHSFFMFVPAMVVYIIVICVCSGINVNRCVPFLAGTRNDEMIICSMLAKCKSANQVHD